MDEIRVLFVLSSERSTPEETSNVMQDAFQACKQNVVNVSWIQETECLNADLSKTDFIVFEDFKFKDPTFKALRESKCVRILGPWCILICLMDGIPIPNFKWPIYNVAMLGCVVASSQLSKTEKQQIKERVQFMGGCYTDDLVSANTHLVTGGVKSEKYLQAAERGVKLMIHEWIEAVYSASLVRKVHSEDAEFEMYRCLPFHKLSICSTGFPNVETRSAFAQLVVKHGGIFTGALSMTSTDILIVHGESGRQSQKFKAARTNPNLYCVTPQWVHDSVAHGYALPHKLYIVKNNTTSTPTKNDETCPDFSIVSAIGDHDRYKSTMEETRLTSRRPQASLTPNRISPNKRKFSASEIIDQLINGLDIKRAKRAGQYLDGCSVYVAGFKPEQREKLCKILNLSGATRYDDVSDRLTHMIVGDPSCPEVKIVKSKNYVVSLVSIEWLLDSMEKQQALDEEDYLIRLRNDRNEQFNSPLGKKGLNLLRSNRTLTSDDLVVIREASKSIPEPEAEDNLMQAYLKRTSKDDESDTLAQLLDADSNFNSKPEVEEEGRKISFSNNDCATENSEMDVRSSQFNNVFISKKFVLLNFNIEEYQCLREQIESVGGVVLPKTYKGIPDYVVAPQFIQSPIHMSALEVVNTLWIIQSIQQDEECPISYFHQPLVATSNKPLTDCIVSISGYSSYERSFLQDLIKHLGGIFQEQLSRVTKKENNILPSTHLVCLEAEGRKYRGALKWGITVINKDWLLECARTGSLVPVDNFLVREATVPANQTPEVSNKRILTPLNQRGPLNITKTETPISQRLLKNVERTPATKEPHNVTKTETPLNQRLFKNTERTSDACSQVTPVSKIMDAVRRTGLLGTPQSSPIQKTDFDTPESPFGAFLRPHMSAKSKKQLKHYIDLIPDFVPLPEDKSKSTPLSEVKRRCWKKLLERPNEGSPSTFPERSDDLQENKDDDMSVTSSEVIAQNLFIDTKLKQIEDMANAMGSSRRQSKAFQSADHEEPMLSPSHHIAGGSNFKESQPFTVGWDYNEDAPKNQVRIFMLSGIESEVRQAMVAKIESLGGQVTELGSFDPKCTHLVCPRPARNEKALACMAAGKWILHISYIDKSLEAGKFLNEEEFEFGNPKSCRNITPFDPETESRLRAIHWWRQEIMRRGYGAFNDMRAIVVAQKREPLIRVIEAGGGQVIDVTPPFTKNVHATHCLLEVRSITDFSVYNPLAQQGILCINTLYVSDFLFRTNCDVKDAILPHYSRFY